MGFRAKWRIAFDQWLRLRQNGHTFDWLTFDEYYGSKAPFLTLLSLAGQRYIGEVPSNFSLETQGFRAVAGDPQALDARSDPARRAVAADAQKPPPTRCGGPSNAAAP